MASSMFLWYLVVVRMTGDAGGHGNWIGLNMGGQMTSCELGLSWSGVYEAP